MPLNEVEHKIVKTVVDRFLNVKQPSERRKLVVLHKSTQALFKLVSANILANIAIGVPTDEEIYAPLSLAFHYHGDPEITERARRSVAFVLHVLQNLFVVETKKKQFTVADVEVHAKKIFDFPPYDVEIQFGLYLIRDFVVLNSYTMSSDKMEVVSVDISERIVEIPDCGKAWDDYIGRCTAPPPPMRIEFPETAEVDDSIFLESSDLGWPLIHPEIVEITKSRFDTKHFADAAESAFKHINERIKKIVRDRTGHEYDGAPLMQKAFSKEFPILKLGDLSTVIGRDMQIGYQQIFSGSIIGIRNPKAHSNIQIDAVRAMHFIFLASLLMYKVDEALALESVSSATDVAVEPKKTE